MRRDLAEGRRLDRVPEYLAPDILVTDGASSLLGLEAAGTALAARLAALPGLALVSEEMLWAPSAQNAFVAAQRFHCAARHDGPGLYGPPSGKALRYLTMSESWCVSDRLRAEWVLRDEAAILAQIGVTPEEGARWRLAQMAETGATPLPDPGQGSDDAWGHTLGDLIHRLMSGDLSTISRHYDPAAELFHPGAATGSGPAEAEAFWLALRAAFPSARFEVAHLLGAEEPLSPPRAAIRWTLTGRHDGYGAFGTPTGAEVTVLGMTQAEFGPDGLRREWTLYDAPGVWAQILRATGG
nr:ester cyclase [Salipiger pentaromativorans]